jgi:hypothetical protein
MHIMIVLFNFIRYLAPPRQVGGSDPRDALGRHPSAGPRRWRPAGGPGWQEPNWI